MHAATSVLNPLGAVEVPSEIEAELPDYADQLTTFHNAFSGELRALVEALPIPKGSRVLDLASGDGFFSACFAGRQPPLGEVVAADLSRAYLQLSRQVCGRAPAAAPLAFVEANAYELPFEGESFDAVWCAQSLISLEDAPKALSEMRRVLRPGGLIAILENDVFHHVLLNMSVEMELCIQKALAAACRAQGQDMTKYSPARNGLELLLDAGFLRTEKKSLAFDRTAPFDPFTRRFVELHFRQLREQVGDFLSKRELDDFDRFAAGAGCDSFFARPASELTCLNTLFTAVR